MARCPPACAVCRDCPVDVPHYCEATMRALDAAHAKWVAWNEAYREGLGLARQQEVPTYDPPACGIVDLFAWGEQTYRELHQLDVHAVDRESAERAGRVVANLPAPYAEAIWRAYVERGNREDAYAAKPRGRVQSMEPFPDLLKPAERAYLERLKEFLDSENRSGVSTAPGSETEREMSPDGVSLPGVAAFAA